jgi:pimeloyl-ACP methyl ester carboxylesterase
MASPSLHLETSGAGAPVLLLHSSGMSGRQWRRLVPELAREGFRALVPDLGGHGASPTLAEPEPFSFRQDVARLLPLLEEIGAAQVVGHSYGGLLALHLALAAPARVRALVLFEPVAFAVLAPRDDRAALAELAGADLDWGPTADDRVRWMAGFIDYWGGTGAWQQLKDEVRAEYLRTAWVVREGVRTLLADRTPPDAFGAVQVPTLLMTGERSTIAARAVVRRLAELLPAARVEVFRGLGHLAPVAAAERVNPAILAALRAQR